MTRRRLSPRARHDELMAAALKLAEVKGYMQVTRDDIALAAGCSPALVSAVFGTMAATRRSMIRAAIANEVLQVVAQGLAIRDVHAMRAPADLRERAAGSLAK